MKTRYFETDKELRDARSRLALVGNRMEEDEIATLKSEIQRLEEQKNEFANAFFTERERSKVLEEKLAEETAAKHLNERKYLEEKRKFDALKEQFESEESQKKLKLEEIQTENENLKKLLAHASPTSEPIERVSKSLASYRKQMDIVNKIDELVNSCVRDVTNEYIQCKRCNSRFAFGSDGPKSKNFYLHILDAYSDQDTCFICGEATPKNPNKGGSRNHFDRGTGLCVRKVAFLHAPDILLSRHKNKQM